MSSSETPVGASLRAWPLVALGFGVAIGLAVQAVREMSWLFAWEFGLVQALLLGGLAFVLCAAPDRWRWPAVFGLVLAGLAALASVTATLRFGSYGAENHLAVPRGIAFRNVLCGLIALTFFQTWQSAARMAWGAEVDSASAPADANANYGHFFGHSWQNLLVTGVSLCFLGLFWLLLWLFAQLFDSVGISALKDLIEEPFFSWPASCGAVAVSVAFTRDLEHIVAALRRIVLALFAVLTPLFLALSLAFLLALVVGGFERLSSLVSASKLLIVLTCFGILFVNAVIRDGAEPAGSVARTSALLLLPCLAVFCGFAVYAIGIRIEQHGLTPERIFVASATAVLTLWSVAYLGCLIGRGRWMVHCRRVNMAMALIVAVLMAALQSPLADPYQLSAENQYRRLVDGKADPATFDYGYLKFRLGKAGLAAGDRLAEGSGKADPDIVSRRLATLARDGEGEARFKWNFENPDRVQRLPPTLEVPDDVVAAAYSRATNYLSKCGTRKVECVITTFDLTDSPGLEFLIAYRESDRLFGIVIVEDLPSDAGWRTLDLTVGENVDRLWASLLNSDLEAVPTLHRDLRIGEEVIRFHEAKQSPHR